MVVVVIFLLKTSHWLSLSNSNMSICLGCSQGPHTLAQLFLPNSSPAHFYYIMLSQMCLCGCTLPLAHLCSHLVFVFATSSLWTVCIPTKNTYPSSRFEISFVKHSPIPTNEYNSCIFSNLFIQLSLYFPRSLSLVCFINIYNHPTLSSWLSPLAPWTELSRCITGIWETFCENAVKD